MNNFKLSAKPRKLFGRKVKALRRAGVIPGNVFGKKTTSTAVQLDQKELINAIRTAGETSLIDLTIEGEKKARPVLISGYAQDPVTEALLHIDLHQVDLTVKTTATVPLETIGESPATEAGNVLVVLKQEVDVEALPADLPEKIELDVSELKEVGDSILAKDIKGRNSKIEIQVEDDEPIVTVQEPAKEPEPEEPAEPAEGEGDEAGEPESAESSPAEESGESESKE